MALDFKYTILYIFLCLLLFRFIIIYGSSVCKSLKIVEGLTEFEKYSQQVIPFPENARINYNNTNSSEYSHTVNLPINDPVSCKNFCGPNAKCLLTKEQCTSDIDCQGCNPGPTNQTVCQTKEVDPYDGAGKLGQNQGLQYSPLTTGYNNHNVNFAQIYPNSKDAQINRPYEGLDQWTDSFNKGLELYNKKRSIADKYNFGSDTTTDTNPDTYMTSFETKYPTTVSATGLFYETTPPASNSTLFK